MNKTNLVITIFFTLLFLNSCGTIAKGLGGSKKKGSDEFLVEKKAPLVLPPSFGELPKPGIKKNKNIGSTKESNLSIEEIIRKSSSSNSSIINNQSNSSIEESIIKNINKKKIKVNLEEATEEILEIPKKKNILQKLKEKITEK
tara:strand:- start:196 stop:627 length:432 start_codon:yes stop_codon:yes gene_type:complete